MEVVSVFDGREILDMFAPELVSQLARFQISLDPAPLISEMIKAILEDHLTFISSWVKFTVHPTRGIESTYVKPNRCKDILSACVEKELNKQGLTIGPEMEVTWNPVSLLLSAQLTTMVSSCIVPGKFPTVNTWDVYLVETLSVYCIYQIVSLGDYRIAAWQQLVEEKAVKEYGDMHANHDTIRVIEQGYGDVIEAMQG